MKRGSEQAGGRNGGAINKSGRNVGRRSSMTRFVSMATATPSPQLYRHRSRRMKNKNQEISNIMSQNEKITIFDFLRHFYATFYATYTIDGDLKFCGSQKYPPKIIST